MTMVDSFISVAEGYIGAETFSPRQRRIVEFYNLITPLPRGYRLKFNDAWCAAFISAVGYMIGVTPEVIRPECGAHEMYRLYPAAAHVDETEEVRRGDLIFYDWNHDGRIDHVGIVDFAAGEQLQVLEGNKDGAVGYRYVKRGDPSIFGITRPAWEEEEGSEMWVDCDSLNLRAAPSMNAEILESMIYRSPVKVLGDIDGWAIVKYYDTEGYCGAGYLSDVKPPEKGKLTTAVNLREEAGTDKKILRVLPAGTVFHYTGDREMVGSSVWERIYVPEGSDDGFVGWVNRKYTEAVS